MKKLTLVGLLVSMTSFLWAQKADEIINAKEALRIESVLASDEMRGRRVNSPEIEKAADFIAEEFKAAGLKTWDGGDSYRQEFAMVSPRQVSLSARFDNQEVDSKNIIVVTSQADFNINQSSGY